ncbi:MAG: hypothetical protein GF317_16070 [Candidatus Lokiarchaeota archaeon]|nr:hypothetical protein [Candidatus Lokiarchaeota archaeon]MBD3201051.1 hypothetical protein [Candidatus Lokiarchaeota archaeon]
MKFPEVEGRNLEGTLFKLPYDLKGKLNLVIIAFKRNQQSLIDEWRFYLSQKIQNYEDFHIYELPSLNNSYRFMKFIIDGGMRAGIPDESIRQHTITLYLNKNSFKKALGIKTEDKIYLLLIDNNGNIIWRESGGFTSLKFEDFEKNLSQFQ